MRGVTRAVSAAGRRAGAGAADGEGWGGSGGGGGVRRLIIPRSAAASFSTSTSTITSPFINCSKLSSSLSSSVFALPRTRSHQLSLSSPPIHHHNPQQKNSLHTTSIHSMSSSSSPVTPYVAKDGDPVLPLFSLKGKTAIVSGAGAGIGYAVADAFAEAGADVVIWYHSNDKAHERAREIAQRWGRTCVAMQVDVTRRADVGRAVDEAVEQHLGGRLDVFVANAGIPWTMGPILEAGEEGVPHYHKVRETDLDSVYYSALSAGKYFKQQRSGSFVATASMSGHIVNVPQLQSAYNAIKAAVTHYCRSLAVEWATFGARANSVSPGYIATEISNFVPEDTKKIWRELTPMKREGLANELKGAYLYLASDASTFTTGSDIRVDGGYCLT